MTRGEADAKAAAVYRCLGQTAERDTAAIAAALVAAHNAALEEVASMYDGWLERFDAPAAAAAIRARKIT